MSSLAKRYAIFLSTRLTSGSSSNTELDIAAKSTQRHISPNANGCIDHYSKTHSVSTPAADEKALLIKQNPVQSKDEPTVPKANGSSATQPHNHEHRPHSLHRASSEKVEPGSSSPKTQKDPKAAPIPRRNSWMSSISSKFSSSTIPTSTSGSSSIPISKSAPNSPQPESSNAFVAAGSPTAKDVKKADTPPSTSPTGGKGGHTFIQSALRRLGSSGAGGSTGKAAGSGGVCPRKTMNVDPYRERCSLPDLDLKKLRRVAFCVDVEIAGAAQYIEEDPQAPPVPSLTAEPSLIKLEHETEAKRRRDQKLKKGEGAALKNSNIQVEETEKDGVNKVSVEEVKSVLPEISQESKAPEKGEIKEPTRKKEKKKRSEGERKERKERKHQEALANGSIPIEVHREGSSSSVNDTATGTDTPPKSQDRPTTDPLRIYRRCCQLRETPILKRIVEQISSPSACHATTPGILSNLDLSGYWMQLPDLITLGDYLAVVPVKRLVLENCGLGDEAIRVLLAGLLAAKTPEQAKYNKKLAKKLDGKTTEVTERLGVIEKLILKDNPKIGKEGWRHIALFMYMSRSLKGIDVSMIPFPKPSAMADSVKQHHHNPLHHTLPPPPGPIDMATLFQEAIAERLGGDRLEEIVMAECGLSTECVGKIVDGVMKCGATRLGLAGNNITREGLSHVIRYVQSGNCEGLDLGGNDLREDLNMLAEALDEKSTMWALSLADCNLAPSSLESLLPALVQLPNFRFIDLSHNRDLFLTRPTALGLIRKYVPQMSNIRRLHLMDVAMTPEHAIALAEVLPEIPCLAHLNILDNHLLSPLASAKTEAMQEEACALYASLMAAVRVSDTIICIDVDVPSQDSSEVVKALAKQVVAYSLRNLELLPLAESSDSAKAAMADPHGGEKQLTVPDILLHLVGHVDGFPENHDNDEPAPDDDYIVGGTGVVKALDICLNRAADGRKDSRDLSPLHSGTGTPKKVLQGSEVSKGKAREMSKNLLNSARKIRARLQPALIKEAKTGNDMSYRECKSELYGVRDVLTSPPGRLQFLDSTLERMIERFENEYPETRLPKPTAEPLSDDNASTSSSFENPTPLIHPTPTYPGLEFDSPDPEDIDDNAPPLIRPASVSRRASSPNLASRQAQEEGRMHRFGQRVKRDILRPETEDYAHGTTGAESEAQYLKDLRRRLEAFEGGEIKDRVETLGPETVFNMIGATAEELEAWERGNPEGFERIKEARGYALALYEDQKGGTGFPAREHWLRKREDSAPEEETRETNPA